MAEPSRAPETVESVDGAHFLIIEARFYDAIGALALSGATRALDAAFTLAQFATCAAITA